MLRARSCDIISVLQLIGGCHQTTLTTILHLISAIRFVAWRHDASMIIKTLKLPPNPAFKDMSLYHISLHGRQCRVTSKCMSFRFINSTLRQHTVYTSYTTLSYHIGYNAIHTHYIYVSTALAEAIRLYLTYYTKPNKRAHRPRINKNPFQSRISPSKTQND